MFPNTSNQQHEIDKFCLPCTLAQSGTPSSSQHFLYCVVFGVRHQIILDQTFLADPGEVKFFSYPVWSPQRELALLGKGQSEILTCVS